MPTSTPLGEVIFSSVKPIIRMYLIILTGIFLARKGLLSAATSRAFSDMALILFLPALVFNNIVSYISVSDIKTIGVIVLSAVMLYGINAAVATLMVFILPVPKAKDNRWVGGAMLAGIMQNVSDLPIAYLQAMSMLTTTQSNKGVAYVIIWLMMYVIFQFNLGLFQLVDWDFRYMREHKDDPESVEDSTESTSTGEKEAEKKEQVTNQAPPPITTTNTTSSSLSDSIHEAQAQPINEYEGQAEGHNDSRRGDNETLPISPTSSISNASLETEQEPVSRISSSLHPRSLVRRTTTTASKLFSPSRSHPAIARLPSARANYDAQPVSIYGDNASNFSRRSKPESLAEQLVREYSRAEPHNQNTSTAANIVTETQLSHKDVEAVTQKVPAKLKFMKFAVFFIANLKKPASVSLVVSLLIALVPQLKALFTNEGLVQLPNAPDHQPALSFLLMYANYLGLPCVPLGLLLIGSTLGRLQVSVIPKGFWKYVVSLASWRLCILPIIGIAWATKLRQMHWLDDDMAVVVNCIEYALPSATVQIYITASNMTPGANTNPMNCLAICIITQYLVLLVSLPIVVCWAFKRVIGM